MLKIHEGRKKSGGGGGFIPSPFVLSYRTGDQGHRLLIAGGGPVVDGETLHLAGAGVAAPKRRHLPQPLDNGRHFLYNQVNFVCGIIHT